MNKEVKLIGQQNKHFEKLCQSYDKNKFIVDLSDLGTGKTVITMAIAQKYKKKLIVICPLALNSSWLDHGSKYDVKIDQILTYDVLAGTKHGIHHKYLDFNYKLDRKGNLSKDRFLPSKYLLDLIDKDATMFVFDECVSLMNPTLAFEAALCIINACRDKICVSLISGHPIDKDDRCINMLRLMGIMNGNEVCNRRGPTGILDVVNYSRNMDRDKSEEIIDKYGYNKASIARYTAYMLLSNVILPKYSSRMNMPQNPNVYNLHVGVPKETYKSILEATDMLEEASYYDRITNTVSDRLNETLGAITKSMQLIEIRKTPVFIKLAESFLKAKQKLKIVIFVIYKESMKLLKEGLKEYDPLVLNGDTDKDERGELISKFQSRDLKYRVIIVGLQTASLGINLNDTTGLIPRVTLISPTTFRFKELSQCSARTYRMNTIGKAFVYFVYAYLKGSENLNYEMRILNNLQHKSNVSRMILQSETNKYPGEYEVKKI